MARRWRMRAPESIHDVNMTPLIDVSLVLVVILMVATPMAFQSSIGVSKASAAGKAAAVARSERVEITILSAEQALVNNQAVPLPNMEVLLRPLLTLSATKTVVIRCGDDVPHGTFVNVLDTAKQCGAAQIAVVGG